IYLIQNYNLKNYIPENKFLAGLLYKDAKKLVCVSKAIEQQLKEKYHFTNTATIYNPVNLNAGTISEAVGMPEKYILYFGRFDEKAKNFSLMLEAFADSEIHKKGFQLVLMGEGPDRNSIEIEIAKRNVGEFVTIIPYQKNPFGIVKKAKYTILTSRFEGFPLSIGESLAMGTPVIAVDCKSGPSEVIVNKKNGLLVENYNPQAFSKAMNLLIDDSELYQTCKQNAAASVSHLSLESISKQWQEVLSSFV
ncbi:MAG TPA: glycosyltransferase, partial [Flavobacterium sp.]|nr:glycosyltransferase [Flavobacterium sp.]